MSKIDKVLETKFGGRKEEFCLFIDMLDFSLFSIQTLRNQLIASTFFASRFSLSLSLFHSLFSPLFSDFFFFCVDSALFVSFFSLSEVGYVSGDDDNDTEDGFISIDSLTFHEVKVLILGLDFFVAFCCFILCTRWAGQMSIIIAACSSPGQEGGPVGPVCSFFFLFLFLFNFFFLIHKI